MNLPGKKFIKVTIPSEVAYAQDCDDLTPIPSKFLNDMEFVVVYEFDETTDAQVEIFLKNELRQDFLEIQDDYDMTGVFEQELLSYGPSQPVVYVCTPIADEKIDQWNQFCTKWGIVFEDFLPT
jgi:hypothetical protein